MDTLNKLVVDGATGESQLVPFTKEETAEHLAEQQRIAEAEANAIVEEKAKAEAKQLLLDKLGISEEEAKLLLS